MSQSLLFDTDTMKKSATISDCGLYRYDLTRTWGPGSHVNFIMLNPSVADATEDDPTIRRCIRFARDWGYFGLVVTNLFAFRATNPKALKKAKAPIGPKNDRYVIEHATSATCVVCAWGAGGSFLNRDCNVRWLLSSHGVLLSALRVSPAGHPWHPLYLPGDSTPVPFKGTTES